MNERDKALADYLDAALNVSLLAVMQRDLERMFPTWTDCPACNGKGTVTGIPSDNGPGAEITLKCETCKGAGEVKDE